MKRIFLLVAFFLYGLPSFSQHSAYNKKVLQYTFKNGLSYGFITGIVQDDNGFMWFATEDGLNRFDGINFRIFKHNDENHNSLPSNYIDLIFKDRQGELWLSSRRGIYRFNIGSEKFLRFRAGVNELINNISCIKQGDKNTLWFSSLNAGFFTYDKSTDKLINYNSKNLPGLAGNMSSAILQDSKGLLWLGADGVQSVFKVSNGRITGSTAGALPLNEIPKQRVHDIVEDHNSDIWFATSSGLAVYQRKLNKIAVIDGRKYNMRSNYFYSLAEDNNNNLLIGLQDGGIYTLDLKKYEESGFKDINISTVRTEDNIDVTERTIEKIFLDKDKNVWAGTYGDGIYLLGNVPEKFKRFRNKLPGMYTAGYLRYYGMCMDQDGNLWMGTDGDGIYKKTLNGDVIKHYYADNSNNGAVKNVAILSAYASRNGDLWFGSYANGLYRYNKKTDEFTNYQYKGGDPYSLVANDVRTIYEASDGSIWAGTNGGGISVLKRGATGFTNFSGNNGYPGVANIRTICEGPNGDMFIGTYGAGLLRYSKADNKFETCLTNAQTDKFLQSKVIYSLKCYGGKLLIGTEADGLLIYDLNNKSFRKYTENDGLANNTINSIQKDDNGNIWVGSNNGLSKIEAKTGKIFNYDSSDGLQTGHFSPGASMYNTEKKFMCFGGTEGYNIFYPDHIQKSAFKPKVIITGLQLFNRDVEVGEKNHILTKTISNSSRIILEPGQSVFSIQYVALNYPYAERSEFAYHLDGLDNGWNYVQNQKFATYRYLEPGDYRFKVKASNQDGIWSQDYATIKIIVLPPWYKTWFAYLCYSLAGAALVYFYLSYKNNQARLRYNIQVAQITTEKEKELNEKKLSFFTNISHEFRTPLTLIINPVKELLHGKNAGAENVDELQVVYRNARRLLSLVDQLLLFRKAESETDKLKIVKLNITELGNEVFSCFCHQAKAKSINFSFHSDNDGIDIYADREKLEIVLFNLLSNAFKFTPGGGAISCNITEDEENVIIKVADSGCGISNEIGDQLFDRFFQAQNAAHSFGGFGIGLYLVKSFIDSHKGHITYDSKESYGTTFSITLQKGKKHFTGNFIYEDVAEPSVFLDELMEEDFDTPVKARKEQPMLNNYDALLTSKKSLLVIEDNFQVRQYIVQLFRDDFEVFESSNPDEGYEMICKLIPAIVISDVMMNGKSGIDLCAKIKSDPSLNHIPFILLTANALPEIKIKGLECGADDYITKPFEKEALVARVNGLVKSHDNMHAYFYNEVTLNSNNLKISPEYKQFLERCITIVEKHLDDEKFSIKQLADEIGMSHSNLYKKIKAISGGSANEFIRHIRLRKSAEIIITTNCTIAEAAYKVGINNAKYFREQFSKLFGVNPSDYIKKFREPFVQSGLHNTLKIKRQ